MKIQNKKKNITIMLKLVCFLFDIHRLKKRLAKLDGIGSIFVEIGTNKAFALWFGKSENNL